MLRLLVLLGGVALFIVGFRLYRRYRLLEDAPFIVIGSLPMGLVHVSGKCTGAKFGTSPLTQLPCFYYLVLIDEQGTDRGQSVCDEGGKTPFHLEDATGKVLVNPTLAVFDLTPSFQGVLGPKGVSRHVDESLGVPAPTEEHLRAYLVGQLGQSYAAYISRLRAEIQSAPPLGRKSKEARLHNVERRVATGFSGRTYQLTEYCLVNGRTCNIMGTCAENPAPADEHDRNLITRGENEKTFVITNKPERKAARDLRTRALLSILAGSALILLGCASILQWVGVF